MDSEQDTSKMMITLKLTTCYSNEHTKVAAKNLNDDFNYETEEPLMLRIKIPKYDLHTRNKSKNTF
jgi:hypothetical protein